MAYKILNGQNENEALIVPKPKNRGFFENFFNFSVKFVFSSNISCFQIYLDPI